MGDKSPETRGKRRNRASLGVLARIGLLAAAYALLTVVPPFSSISYGPIQVRLAEALTVLAYLFPWAKWGLYFGCILANLGSPFLIWDITLGAFATLFAAWLSQRMPRPYLAPLPPVLVNAIVVSAYVAPLSGVPYWPVVLYIALGEAVACYGLGYPLLLAVSNNEKLLEVLRGRDSA